MTEDADRVWCEEHEWLEVGGASDRHTAERFMRCTRCGAECIVETPRELEQAFTLADEDKPATRKVTDIRKARDERAPKTKVYVPDRVDQLIGVCPGPEQEPGEIPTHLLLRAPPGDGCGWALSAQQALELATWLAAAARSVTGA